MGKPRVCPSCVHLPCVCSVQTLDSLFLSNLVVSVVSWSVDWYNWCPSLFLCLGSFVFPHVAPSMRLDVRFVDHRIPRSLRTTVDLETLPLLLSWPSKGTLERKSRSSCPFRTRKKPERAPTTLSTWETSRDDVELATKRFARALIAHRSGRVASEAVLGSTTCR